MTSYILYGIENTVVAKTWRPAQDCSNASKPVESTLKFMHIRNEVD